MALRKTPAFGALLKRYRQAAGLTQEALAEQAGLSVRAVSDLERGLKVRPHQDTVALLAAALQLTAPEHAAFVAARQGNVPPAAGAELPPFVGRSRELVLLERHLAGAGPPLLLLSGEPGIGKSRLLHEAQQRAGAHGLCVLAGGASGTAPNCPTLHCCPPWSVTCTPWPRGRCVRRWRAAPGWCACCPSWRRGPSSPCPPGCCPRPRSGGRSPPQRCHPRRLDPVSVH